MICIVRVLNRQLELRVTDNWCESFKHRVVSIVWFLSEELPEICKLQILKIYILESSVLYLRKEIEDEYQLTQIIKYFKIKSISDILLSKC